MAGVGGSAGIWAMLDAPIISVEQVETVGAVVGSETEAVDH